MNRKDRRKYAKTINTPQKLENFSKHMEYNLRKEYQKLYELKYQQDLDNSIDLFILAIVYTLHFNEKTKFGNNRIEDFMQDLFATVDYFRTGEYDPIDYKNQLEKEGIKILTHNDKVDKVDSKGE